MTGTSRPSARLVDDQTSGTIKNEFTHPDAGPVTMRSHPTALSATACAVVSCFAG